MIGCKNIKRVDVTTGKNKDVTSGSVGYIEMIVRFARYSSDAIEAVEDPMTLPTSYKSMWWDVSWEWERNQSRPIRLTHQSY